MTEQTQALTQRYEDLREATLDGAIGRHLGWNVILSQGMWAWIELVGNEMSGPRQIPRIESKTLPTEATQSLANHPALLGVWTDLLLGHLAAQETI